ncbi:catechol 1,2-dioxygenase [Algoriphagus lutimaris]|uniref:dioxygenase family protein n=1 Tax=Algoriphagus lutimaris TaxID=613197 RepID=UPI00196A76D1|nr:catechol 1,2-dioxygenase [Algoriphagus lutimaris]MBN3519717.1 catechol 1,2-dioxygenase [Algoriphagus lutimaris]
MKRRSFIKNSSLTALSISAFGSIQWNGKSFVGDTPTTTDILGPFYRPGAPMRSDIIPPDSKGIPMNLTGTIFKEDGKTPLDNVHVEIWQCDENEHYDNTSDSFLFRGAIKTEKNGKYAFKTIVPVPYKADPNNDESWRPAHIHMRVSVADQQDLITQIYFKGDKYNDTDTSASSPQAVNRILEIVKNSSGEHSVTFDVVLSKEFPLDQEVYNKITGLYRMDSNSTLEFIKRDDLLFMKRNGQLIASFNYIGNNTFESGRGSLKVTFELLPKGDAKVVVTTRDNTYTGEKFLKYSDG